MLSGCGDRSVGNPCNWDAERGDQSNKLLAKLTKMVNPELNLETLQVRRTKMYIHVHMDRDTHNAYTGEKNLQLHPAFLLTSSTATGLLKDSYEKSF